jgi:hypothetical protein
MAISGASGVHPVDVGQLGLMHPTGLMYSTTLPQVFPARSRLLSTMSGTGSGSSAADGGRLLHASVINHQVAGA